MTPAGEPFAAAIDGLDGSTWALPLAPLTATSTPEAYSPGEQPPADRLAAAARLVSDTNTFFAWYDTDLRPEAF